MEQENQAQQHKRRVRYKGKYPKKFEEKYKELQPEKYQDTVQHVIRKGNTPAGMHISIMVKEILDFLQIQPGETGFDATLGYGGHTKAMLECLHGEGHMYATDVDPEESAKTKKRLEELGYGEDILSIRLQNFCTIDEIAKEVGGFDFILADLGVSSMQIDNPKRGFSFKVDGSSGSAIESGKRASARQTAWIRYREKSLPVCCMKNSDEPYCEELAKAITEEIRRGNRIDGEGGGIVVMADGGDDGGHVSGLHAHLVQNTEGHDGAGLGVVVAVDHVADVVHKAGDAGQLLVVLSISELGQDAGGKLGAAGDVGKAVLGKAPGQQGLVGLGDIGADLL